MRSRAVMRRPQLQRRHIHHSPRHEARRMTENSSRSVTPLPESIKTELRPANARHIATCEGRTAAVPALGQHQQHGGADRRPAPISGIRRDEVETGRAGVLARGPSTSKRRDRLPTPCFFLASAASISDRLCWAFQIRQLCDFAGGCARAAPTRC
jgi:hypothetical protein